MELNAETVKKALECVFSTTCGSCVYKEFDKCQEWAARDAIAFITSHEQRIKELTEENERLRGILLQFTDIVHKWGNKNGYDTTEISLVSITYEANKIKSQIEADTVRKMQRLIEERLDISDDGYSTEEVKNDVFDTIDQIAKEMLEREVCGNTK